MADILPLGDPRLRSAPVAHDDRELPRHLTELTAAPPLVSA